MTIQNTRWSLDTCDCIIDYRWDDSLPNDQIVLTPINTVRTCTAHSAIATNPTAHYSILMDENPRKNQAIQHILDNGPATLYDIVGSNRVAKLGINLNFSWSGVAPNRVLTINIVGVTLTNQQKNTAQNALNAKFGTGKVVLA